MEMRTDMMLGPISELLSTLIERYTRVGDNVENDPLT